MIKKVIFAGVLGGIVFIVWIFFVNVIFGFQSRMEMNQIDEERQVYELLKEHILVPGKYIFNPEISTMGRPSLGEPVFSVSYSGVGHEAAGNLMLIELVLYFLIPTLGAWLLSQTSERILSSYPRKLLFFISIGLIIALFGFTRNYGIGNYSLQDALLLALHHIVVWTLMGSVVAWRIKPLQTKAKAV